MLHCMCAEENVICVFVVPSENKVIREKKINNNNDNSALPDHTLY